MRFSRQRQVILGILNSSDGTPDVDWIFREAKKVVKSISIATVHRNLKLLTENGEITPVETEEGALRYNTNVGQNTHFICNRCKEVFEIGLNDLHLPELDEKGFCVNNSRHVYYGYCKNCLDKDNSDSKTADN